MNNLINYKNFITIDFEVASRYMYSPCAVSIFEFCDGKIKQLLSTLINPGDVYFDPALTKLHGITMEMTQTAPELKDVLSDICKIIDNKFIFAHNASYDISKIIRGCKEYNIEIPYFEYADSLAISKRTWLHLINYKLDTVSEYLNIDLQHHNSASDAIACGKIILEALKEHNTTNIIDLLDKTKYVKGCYDNTWIHSYSKKIYCGKHSKTINVKEIEINTEADTEMSGKYFVFTGTLSIKRKEAMELVGANGGIPENGVTKNTNYLVVGKDDYNQFKEGNKSNKMLKAEKLIQEGQDLELITEDDFLDMIPLIEDTKTTIKA